MTLRTLLAAFVCTAALSAQTFVVDDDGGPLVDFTDIQPAVDASEPGDVILVRDGAYTDVLVTRGVRIVADPLGTADLGNDAIEIRDVPAGETASLAGLAMRAVYVHDCAGHVVLDALDTDTSTFVTTLRIYDCALVTLSRSTIAGGSGSKASPGLPTAVEQRAVDVLRSTLVLSGAELSGGRGGANYKTDGRDGQPALFARDSTLFVQTSTLVGGRGGDAWDPFEFAGDGGDGAVALRLERCEVEVSGRETDVLRGGGGGDPGFVSLPGAPAAAIEAVDSDVVWSRVGFETAAPAPVFDGVGSTFVELAPAVPALWLDGAATIGGAGSWSLVGEPGAAATFYVSAGAGAASLGAKHTQLLIDPTTALSVATLGLDGNGDATLPFVVPALAELVGVALHVQAVVVPTSGPTRLSSSSTWVLR